MKQKGTKGFYEQKKEILTDKGIEHKAPIHRENATRNKLKNTLRCPFEPLSKDEKEDEFVSLKISGVEEEELAEIAEEFAEEFDAELTVNEDESITCPAEFTEFLDNRGIEYEYVNLEDEIVEEVQEKRKDSAKAKDSSKTAKRVGDKEDAKDLLDWIKNPGKSDLKEVDTEEDD